MDLDKIYHQDCLEGMQRIPDHSIDLALVDLPYGTTRNKWDSIIPLEPLWREYKRVIKDNGAILLWSQIPFTIRLGASNLPWLRYEWTIEKSCATGFLNAKRMPLKAHESILVFYRRLPTYHPQMRPGQHKVNKLGSASGNYGHYEHTGEKQADSYYPRDVLRYSNGFSSTPTHGGSSGRRHPTQKPLDISEYMIRTYTDPGDTVLDNCAGSGTTCVAAIRTGRHFIGYETEQEYVELANERIAEAQANAGNL